MSDKIESFYFIPKENGTPDNAVINCEEFVKRIVTNKKQNKMNIELKENEYLILHSDEIKHLKEIENDELEGYFETSSNPLTPTSLLIRAVCIYMASNGQLVRGIDELLRNIQEGIERAVEDMEETKNLDYDLAICLVEDLYQSKIK